MENSTAGAFSDSANDTNMAPESAKFFGYPLAAQRFVVVGQDVTGGNHIRYSDDFGSTITDVTLTGSGFTATSADVKQVIHDGTNYVFVGTDGSNNPIVNTTASLSSPSYSSATVGGSSFEVDDIIQFAGLYVISCAGGDQEIRTSSTAAGSYTQRTTFTGGPVYLGHNGQIAVAVTSSNEIKSSTDGLTWTTRTSPASSGTSFRKVQYDNGYFFAYGEDSGTPKLIRSPDGITWTDISGNLPGAFTPSGATNIMDCGNGLVVIGESGTYYVSSDSGGSFDRDWETHPASFR